MKLLLLLLLFTISVHGDLKDCGSPSSFPINRSHGRVARHIIGGNQAPMGKWPWQVLIRKRFTGEHPVTGQHGTWEGRCGGTVISDRWILTAGHCFDEGFHEDTVVISGITHAAEDEPERILKEKRQEYVVQDLFMHPKYSIDKNDIALLKLKGPISFDRSVSPICLPHGDQPIPEDGQGVVVGFGDNNKRGDDDSHNLTVTSDGYLRDTSVPFIRLNRCKSRLVNVPEIRDLARSLTSNQICAGSFGHGTAEGDSGGPLQMPSTDGRWFQLGITSYGDLGSLIRRQDIYPGVYTNVKKYCNWIKKTTNGEAACQEDTVTLKDVEIVV